MNKICVDNCIDKSFIDECDNKFEEKLSLAAMQVYTGSEKIIGLTGPTCSGKTTASNMLAREISKSGACMKVISLDDFFKDVFSREDISSDDADGLDFDSPDTMDNELLKSFIDDLFTKGEAEKPIFDFKSGKREYGGKMYYNEGDVFVFEGIQVLYPSISKILGQMDGKILFACPKSAIETPDTVFDPHEIRLLRRIVRDKNFRGANVAFTMSLWASVRNNEENNIFPNVHSSCFEIDTTLPYELHVLKPYLTEYFKEINETNKFYPAVTDILKKLENIKGVPSSWIGKESIYKEFV